MNPKEKRIAYFDLKGGQHFKADLALLIEKDPENDWCKKKVFNPERAAPEILFALLDVASKEEVVANRRKFSKEGIQDAQAEKVVALESLVQKLEKATTIDEVHAIKQECDLLIGSDKDLEQKYGPLVDGTFSITIERIEKYNAQALEEATQELLTADISTLDLEAVLSLITRLNISVTSQDPEVLRAALQDAFLLLEKTDQGTGLEKTGIPAELGQVNELNAETNAEGLKTSETLKTLPSEELETLQSENEDLQSENEDLLEQRLELLDQNDSLQAENETLQEELESEKKNLPQEPAPPAVSNKKKTSSPKSTGKSSKKSKSSKRP